MIFRKSVSILYSTDVPGSLNYYVSILGFEHKWEWGHPPTFGGVSKDGVEIFFCKEAQGNPGTWLSVFVDKVDEFYEKVKSKGAKILNPPQTMEWGVREMLIEDPDGHKIRFGQNVPVSNRGKSEAELPSLVRIVQRMPDRKEVRYLASLVGWATRDELAPEEKALSAIVFAVAAEDIRTNEIIGCAFLLGDNVGFYYVKDVIVHPAWQGRRVGSAMMKEMTDWLEENAPDNAYVGLHTGENLAPFYKQFGFSPAFGMVRHIKRS